MKYVSTLFVITALLLMAGCISQPKEEPGVTVIEETENDPGFEYGMEKTAVTGSGAETGDDSEIKNSLDAELDAALEETAAMEAELEVSMLE